MPYPLIFHCIPWHIATPCCQLYILMIHYDHINIQFYYYLLIEEILKIPFYESCSIWLANTCRLCISETNINLYFAAVTMLPHICHFCIKYQFSFISILVSPFQNYKDISISLRFDRFFSFFKQGRFQKAFLFLPVPLSYLSLNISFKLSFYFISIYIFNTLTHRGDFKYWCFLWLFQSWH